MDNPRGRQASAEDLARLGGLNADAQGVARGLVPNSDLAWTQRARAMSVVFTDMDWTPESSVLSTVPPGGCSVASHKVSRPAHDGRDEGSLAPLAIALCRHILTL